MKNISALSLFVLTVCTLHAQSRSSFCQERNLRFVVTTRTYNLIATGVPYTGYCYELFPGSKDTSDLKYYTRGILDWDSSYTKAGKPASVVINYNHGLKNDSICQESVTYNERGDTTNYYIDWVDHNGVKWGRHCGYGTGAPPEYRMHLRFVSDRRFFTREEAKDFAHFSFREDQRYDSLGYHQNAAESGIYTMYSDSGAVVLRGKQGKYEYCMAHKGEYPKDPYTGRLGTWTHYDQHTGTKRKEEVYDGNGLLIDTRTYHPNGALESRTDFRIGGADVKLPSPDGITFALTDSFIVEEKKWYANGNVQSEQLLSPMAERLVCTYHENGAPKQFTARSSLSKPFGIHKKWDEQGRVTEFINYSVEQNDTICFTAKNGKAIAVNLRNPSVRINHSLMPSSQYGSWHDYFDPYLNALTQIHHTYHANGKLKREVYLSNGQLQGAYSEWDSSGVQTLKATYSNGVPAGEWKEWHPNGKLKKKFRYENGVRNGTCTEFYADGHIKWQNKYEHGVPGKFRAFDASGVTLRADTYLDAFYPPDCIERQEKMLAPAALYRYFLDSAGTDTSILVPAAVLRTWARKLMVLNTIETRDYQICAEAKDGAVFPDSALHHTRIAISSGLYTDQGKIRIARFFARNGIQLDSVVDAVNPVLGIQKEYFLYCSSAGIMNKTLLADSLQFYLAGPGNSIDLGYVILTDAGPPAIAPKDKVWRSSMVSDTGYTRLLVERGATLQNRARYNGNEYVIYDDMTYELQRPEWYFNQMTYWPLTMAK